MTVAADHDLLYEQEFAHRLTRKEFDFYVRWCRERGLNEWLRLIIPHPDYDERTGRSTLKFITTIQALRQIALSTKQFQGPTPPAFCGKDGAWRDEWIDPFPPTAATIGVYRKGFREAVRGTATFDAFAVMVEDGDGKRVPNEFWCRLGYFMLAKVAEAMALRAAFPDACGDLYLAEEFRGGIGGETPNGASGSPASSRRGWNPDAPTTTFQFELSLSELGLRDPGKRRLVIDHFKRRHADDFQKNPLGFYQLVVAAVKADPHCEFMAAEEMAGV